MIDGQRLQLAFLLFEAILCFILTPLYAVSKDPPRVRKSVVLALNITCGCMLLGEYLFYVYEGASGALNVLIMQLVNAAVYYLIVLLLFFYAMLVFCSLTSSCLC